MRNKLKFISSFFLLMFTFSFIASVTAPSLIASDVSNEFIPENAITSEEVIHDIEKSNISGEKADEITDLLEDIDGVIIGTSDFDNSSAIEYNDLTSIQQAEFDKHFDELMVFSDKYIDFDEGGVPYITDFNYSETDEWSIYESDNDIIINFGDFETYLIDNEFIDAVDIETANVSQKERSPYTYKYTRYSNNKEWVTAVDIISLSTGGIAWKTSSALLGTISLAAAAFSFIGQRLYKTLYTKIDVYSHNTCPYKGKTYTRYYQYSNWTGYIKSLTRYQDGTNSYQKCLN